MSSIDREMSIHARLTLDFLDRLMILLPVTNGTSDLTTSLCD